MLRAEALDRLQTGGCLDHFQALVLQQHAHQCAEGVIVLHEKHLAVHSGKLARLLANMHGERRRSASCDGGHTYAIFTDPANRYVGTYVQIRSRYRCCRWGSGRKVETMKQHTYPSLNRRDLIKAGVFAGAALSLPLSAWCRANRCSTIACRRASCRSRSRRRSRVPPVAVPGTQRRHDRLLRDVDEADARSRSCRASRRCSSATTGSVPGPTIKVNQGREAVVRHMQHAAERAPDARLRAVDVGAPARLGVAAAVRRLRQRHHPPRASSRTTTTRTSSPPERSGTTTTACTTPPRTCTTGSLAQYHMFDPLEQSLPIPHGRLRRAVDHRRTHCSTRTVRCCSRSRTSPACGAT